MTSHPRGGALTSGAPHRQLHKSDTVPRTRQDNASTLSDLPELKSFSRIRKANVISRSFGSSLFHSLRRPSRSLTVEPSRQSRGSQRSPLVVFKDLLDLLLSRHVPGPSLYRTRTEYSKRLGSGRTFEVLGAAPALLDLVPGLESDVTTSETGEKAITVRKALANTRLVAIKRAHVDEQHVTSQASSSSAESLTRAFGHQLACVEREIENLCHSDLRGHPNIIKMLGWGLCLDTLEDITAPEPRVPLLILEKADYTLGHLIASKELACHFPCLPTHDRQLGILRNVGDGLEAIHKAGLIHGDIKLENILIFKTGKHLVAKLSDFGLTVAGSESDPNNTMSNYRGTPRWCPLSGSARYTCQDLYAFDHFAYGLVAWCIFADLSHSPLPSEERAGAETSRALDTSTLFDVCLMELEQRHTEIVLPLRFCLRACLGDDPVYWRRFPWRSLRGITYWEAKAYQYKVDTVPQKLRNEYQRLRTHISSFPSLKQVTMSLLGSYSDIGGHAPENLVSFAQNLQEVRRRLLRVPSRLWNTRREFLSQRGVLVRALSRDVKKQAPLFRESRQSQFLSHPDDSECWNFNWLVERLKRCINGFARRATKAQTDELYALLRVRSRLPFCCLRKSGLKLNCVEFALQKEVNFETLSWACHGETGKKDLYSLDLQVLAIWLVKLKTNACPWKATDIVSRLVLLVEKGCRIDHTVQTLEGEKSIFRIMLEISFGCGNDVARDVFIDCIIRMQTREMDTIESASRQQDLRHFLTGHGLRDHLGDIPDYDTNGRTTALHESVKMASYRMVEALVLNKFQINALDVKGKTAYQYSGAQFAQANNKARVEGTETYEADRIAALLGQSTDSTWSPYVRQQSQSSSETSLAVGWDRVSLTSQQVNQQMQDSARPSEPASTILYLDRHFGSMTLKSPTFSFFTDQRLALGFRKVHLPGQTYHLDLLRFLQPPSSLSPRSGISELTHSLIYYEHEASESDTCRTLNMKQFMRVAYSRVQITSVAAHRLLTPVGRAVKTKVLAVWCFLAYLAHWSKSIFDSTKGCIAKPLYYFSVMVLILVLPGQPVNIYLGCVPAAYFARRLAWSFGLRLSVNLVALASLCNLGQTALLVFVGLDRSDSILMDMIRMFFSFIVVPLGNIHIEITCLVFMFRYSLSEALIPFLLAAISWNYHCGMIGYLFGMRPSNVALNAFIFPFLSLLVLGVDRTPNPVSVLLAQITPLALLVYVMKSGAVILLVYLGMTSSILAGRWLSMWERISTKPFWWFWEDRGEILGRSLSAPQQPRSMLRLTFAFITLPLTIGGSVFICSEIISMIAEHKSQAARGLTLYLSIPLAIRFSQLHIAILALLKSGRLYVFNEYGRLISIQASAGYVWYLKLTSLGSGSLLSDRYYAPASDTFVLWALVYPFMSFVRLVQGQPFSVETPELNVTRSVLVCLALPSATYMSIVKQGDKRVRHIFM